MELYTIKEVAERLKISPYTLRTIIGKHELDIYRVGRAIRISDEAIEDYLQRCKK